MDSGSLTRDNIVARNCSIRSPFPTTNQSLVNCTSTIAVLTYHKACSRSGLLSQALCPNRLTDKTGHFDNSGDLPSQSARRDYTKSITKQKQTRKKTTKMCKKQNMNINQQLTVQLSCVCVKAGPQSAVLPWPDHFFATINFFQYSLPFTFKVSPTPPRPVTTALWCYMAGSLFKS